MQTTATTAATPEGFTDAEWEKFERFEAAKKAKHIAAERERLGLTAKATLRRNETGSPYAFTSGCTAGDELLLKEICCDGTDPGCRQRRSKPQALPGEAYLEPAGHRRIVNPALPEVDPASVANERTAQDRLVLGELRAAKEATEGPAIQAEKTDADLAAQERILAERRLQQRAEVDRRRAHVQAAEAKINQFLESLSEAKRTALLAGTAEVSLEAAKRATDEAQRRRPQVRTVDDLRRQAGDTGPAVYKAGAGGQPVRLTTDVSR